METRDAWNSHHHGSGVTDNDGHVAGQQGIDGVLWIIADDIDANSLEDLRVQVENTLNEMADEVDAIIGLNP